MSKSRRTSMAEGPATLLQLAFLFFSLSSALADDTVWCAIAGLLQSAAQQGTNSTQGPTPRVTAVLPGGVCSAIGPPVNLKDVVLVGSQQTTTAIADLGFSSQGALQLPGQGTRLQLQGLTLGNALFGNSFLSLQTVTAETLILSDVNIVTDCWTVFLQLQRPEAANATKGSTYVFITSYTASGLTATNVNISCAVRMVTHNNTQDSQPSSANVLHANDSLSLYNAIIAALYLEPNMPQDIDIVNDISIDKLSWRQPVIMTRSLNITGRAFVPQGGTDLVNPVLDWAGRQQLLTILDSSVRLWFMYLDMVNIPPLTGVYLRESAMTPSFCLPFWPVWYGPDTVDRLNYPIYMTNASIVVPKSEYNWWISMTVTLTSNIGDVVAGAVVFKRLFNRIVPDLKAPVGVVSFTILDGIGLNATNFKIMAVAPARIAFPRVYDDQLIPTFNVELAKTPLIVTTINVYTPLDLLTGLQGMQATQDIDQHDMQVNIIIWRNISFQGASVNWPAQGFNIGTNITISGPPPSWFTGQVVPSLTVLDFAGAPNLMTMNPTTAGAVNTVTFQFLNVMNFEMSRQSSLLTFVADVCVSSEMPWDALDLSCIVAPRTGGLPRYLGYAIVFQDSTVITAQSDWRLLAGMVRTPSCSYANATGGQLGATTCTFEQINTSKFYAARTAFSTVPPAGFTSMYTNIPFPSASPPSDSSSSSGLSQGAIIGIAVGVAVGGMLLIAAAIAAVVLIRRRSSQQKELEQKEHKYLDKMSYGSPGVNSESMPPTATATCAVVSDTTKSTSRDKEDSAQQNGPGNQNGPQHGDKGTPAGSLTDKDKQDDAARGTSDADKSRSSGGHASTPHNASSNTPAAELQQVMEALAGDINDSHLMLLDAVGQGGFGTVYKARWKGLLVAVKTLVFQDRMVAGGKTQHTALMEAAISSSLAHPYVVTTYSFDIKPLKVDRDDNGANGLKIISNTITDWKLYIIQEYCDAGSLRQAVLKGVMWDKTRNQPDMRQVLESAIELASGLSHLHRHNIIHGDLNPNNVLLKKECESRRGVVCKLCDFGLSVKMGEGQSHISNMRRGTPFYAAPEVMSKGNMTTKADVFSFGVMMWELCHSMTCYRVLKDRSFQQRDEFPTVWPAGCPRAYAEVAEACMSDNVATRPSMASVVTKLQVLLGKVERHYQALELRARSDKLPPAHAISSPLKIEPFRASNSTVTEHAVLVPGVPTNL